MNAAIFNITGNATADPILTYTPDGTPVTNFTVAHTERYKKGDEWVDGPVLFMRVIVWRDAAENVANSVDRGTRVMVSGRLRQRSYEKDGVNVQVVELEADEVGVSLKFKSAKVLSTARSSDSSDGS